MARLTADDRVQLRALLGVRKRLAFRRFKGRPQEGALTLLFLLGMLPGPWFLAILSAVAYRRLAAPWDAELLAVILAVLWLLWLLMPVFDLSFNDSFDAWRLLAFPIRRRVMVAAMVLGTVFDYSALFALPFFAAALVSWVDPRTAVIVVPSLVLAYAILVTTGQLASTVFSGLSRSRRFRDAGVAVAGVIWLLWMWLNFGGTNPSHSFKGLVARAMEADIHPMAWLQWTPVGACARAIERSHAGEPAVAAAWLGFGVAWFGLLGFLWWRSLERLATSGEFAFGRRRQSRERAARAVQEGQVARGRVFAPVWMRGRMVELARVDLRLMWRNPRRRMRTLQAAALAVIILGMWMRDSLDSPFAVLMPAAFVGMTGMLAYQNLLAADGKGIGTIFLSPLARTDMFRSRALSFAVMVAAPVVAGCVLLGVVASPQSALVGGLLAVSLFLVFAAVCSGISARFTFPVQQDGKRSAGEGYSSATLAVGILQPILVVVAWAPVWLLLLIALQYERPAMAVAVSLLGLVYGWIAFRLGMRWAGTALVDREPEHFLTLELGKSSR